jgi:hypothetical protein
MVKIGGSDAPHRRLNSSKQRNEGIFLQLRERTVKAATTCLRESIAKARAQHALSLKLRSAMTLRCPLREEGEIAEARQCVASMYDRFTEGFDTADLKLAHAMITE